jgi:hypothetical protein
MVMMASMQSMSLPPIPHDNNCRHRRSCSRNRTRSDAGIGPRRPRRQGLGDPPASAPHRACCWQVERSFRFWKLVVQEFGMPGTLARHPANVVAHAETTAPEPRQSETLVECTRLMDRCMPGTSSVIKNFVCATLEKHFTIRTDSIRANNESRLIGDWWVYGEARYGERKANR